MKDRALFSIMGMSKNRIWIGYYGNRWISGGYGKGVCFDERVFFVGAEHEPKFEVREMTFGPLGPHDILVNNKACGICGTDVHIYHGEKGSAEVTPPVVLGHEFAGVVAKVGEEVTSFKPGGPCGHGPEHVLRSVRSLPCGEEAGV